MKTKIKVLLPNILTLTKLGCIPFILIFSALKINVAALLFLLVAIITNILDHVLASKWNTETNIGTKLDYVSNEVFLVIISAFLTTRFKAFGLLLIIECLIVIVDLIAYYKLDLTKDIKVNIIKKALFYINFLLGFFYLINNGFHNILTGFIFATSNIGFLAFINYIISYYDTFKNKELEESIINDKDKRKKKRIKIYDAEAEDEDKHSDTKVLNEIQDIFKNQDE